MKTLLHSGRTSGFTLIELVISAAVGAMILTGAYLCLSAGLSSQKMIEPRVDALQSARVVLALMSADLRAACPLNKDFAFLGMHRTVAGADADNLDFATHHYTPRREHEGDFCEVSYFVQQDPKSGQLNLWRRRNPTLAPDPLSGGRREEIARGLKGVRFDYTDGFDWYDTWGQTNSDKKTGLIAEEAANLDGMPEAVRITLSFAVNPSAAAPPAEDREKPPEPPLVFQTVVRLELAENAALPAESSASTSPSNPQNATPSGAPGGGPR
jgi:prepilin-type N-terminal cleavage/methylation domain-containing protein